MKLNLTNFNKLLEDKGVFEKALKTTKEEYRPLDPGQYLYNLLLEKRVKLGIFSDEYLELVYTTLISWNMNARGAKLSGITKFKETIKQNKETITKLESYKLGTLKDKDKEEVIKSLRYLFFNLNLTETKSKLVTFSKTLHFLLPELVVPIDRRYTLEFFQTQLPLSKDQWETDKKQFQVFEELFDKFIEISKKYDLSSYLDKVWHVVPTKVIDNAIIGFVSGNPKGF